MVSTAEIKELIGLAGDDARFVERGVSFGRELHREVYKHIFIIVKLDKSLEFLSEDIKRELAEFLHNWGQWYAKDLISEQPKTLEESQACVAEDVAKQIEKTLSDYLPECQGEVVEKLAANLPKRLKRDELEELRDSAFVDFNSAVIASGWCVEAQLVLLRRLKANFGKMIQNLNAGKASHAKTEQGS